ncbi:MAG: hypothetical protein NZ749_06255 [bacterium]|nr:hypothetical protein [bacterium]
MYRILLSVFAICALLPAVAQAQQESIRLAGQVRFTATSGEEMGRYMSYQHSIALRKEPPKGVKLPTWANASCRYGTLRLGKPAQEWHLMVELGGSRVVVDTNRNSDLTDDEVLRGSADTMLYFGTQFGPFRLSASANGTPTARYFSIVTDDMDSGRIYLRSEDYRLFEGEVDGKAVKIVLMDSNADGVFDTHARSRWEGDSCIFLPDKEARALPRYYQVGNRYYRLTFASDGSACEFTPSELQLATVEVEYPQVQLTAIGKEVGYWEASTENGRLQLPADEYSVVSYTFGTRDSKGDQWQATVSLADPVPLKVSAGENRFPLPKELTAALAFGSRQGDTLDVSLVLYAGGRLQQVTLLERNGNLPPPPTLRIIDRNGKTIQVEKFHYG